MAWPGVRIVSVCPAPISSVIQVCSTVALQSTAQLLDKRPRADFVKAYMHNGYLKSLKEVVHFYNTRDALPTCKPGDPGEKLTCWPAPENPETMNRKQLGDLKLSDQQEDLLVAFLKTLTDGYSPPEK